MVQQFHFGVRASREKRYNGSIITRHEFFQTRHHRCHNPILKCRVGQFHLVLRV